MPSDKYGRIELDGDPLGIAVDAGTIDGVPAGYLLELGARVEVEFFRDGELCVIDDAEHDPTDASTSLTFAQVIELRDHLNAIIRNSNGTRRTAPLGRRAGQVIASLEVEVAQLRRARQTASALEGIVEHQHAILDLAHVYLEQNHTEGHVYYSGPNPANGSASYSPGVVDAIRLLRAWRSKPDSIKVGPGGSVTFG